MKNEYLNLVYFLEQGMELSLATVINSSGSPQTKPGNSAIYGSKGLIYGTLGGNLIDTEAGFLAAESRDSSNIYTFDHQSEEDPSRFLQITVLLDSTPHLAADVFRSLKDSLEINRGGVLLTHISDNQSISVERYWVADSMCSILPPRLKNVAADFITGVFKAGITDCRLIKLSETEDLFIEPVFS